MSSRSEVSYRVAVLYGLSLIHILDNAITMYGFSSIESRLEKKKQEREAKQKKEKKVGQMIMVDGVDELVIW